jgi:hypothetical protein
MACCGAVRIPKLSDSGVRRTRARGLPVLNPQSASDGAPVRVWARASRAQTPHPMTAAPDCSRDCQAREPEICVAEYALCGKAGCAHEENNVQNIEAGVCGIFLACTANTCMSQGGFADASWASVRLKEALPSPQNLPQASGRPCAAFGPKTGVAPDYVWGQYLCGFFYHFGVHLEDDLAVWLVSGLRTWRMLLWSWWYDPCAGRARRL